MVAPGPTRNQPIPVIILAGFLGSGKTTILNHILRSGGSDSIGVVVNDFGDIAIDPLLIQNQTSTQMQLSNGCICCQLGDEDIGQLLADFVHTNSHIRTIIIEASGIAEPLTLKKLLLYSPHKHIRFAGIAYTVDPVNITATIRQHPVLLEHIAQADLLVITKADEASKAQLSHAQELCRQHNPQATITTTAYGQLEPGLLYDQVPAARAQTQLRLGMIPSGHDHSQHQHLHDAFTSLSFTTDQPLDPTRFAAFLKDLPPQLYRLKGIIYYGMKGYEQKFIVHHVGHYTHVTSEEWPRGETPHTSLVAIGTQLNRSEILAALHGCIDTTPDTIPPHSLVDIMRLHRNIDA